MPIEDSIGTVGVRVKPIVDPADFKQAIEQAAQQATGAASTAKSAAAMATAAGMTASAASNRPGAFDPKPIAQQIRDLEAVLPTVTKNKPMIESVIAGYRDQLKRNGYDYDAMSGSGGGGGIVRPGVVAGGMDDGDGGNLSDRTRRRDRGRRMVAARTGPRRQEFGNYLSSIAPTSRRGQTRRANLRSGLAFPRALFRAGQSRVMSNGMFMNLLFGGGEASKAWAASNNAGMQAGLAADQASKAQIYLQQYQQASGGFLGSFAGLAIDPFGTQVTGIQATLGLAGVQDNASSAMKALAAMNIAGRTAAPSTATGASMRSLGDAIEKRQNESREQLDKIKQQGKTAGDTAEEAAKTTYGQNAIVAADNQGRESPASIRERENMLAARLGAQRIYERAYDKQAATQKVADLDAVNQMVADSMVSQRRIKRGADNAIKFAGSPAALALQNLADTQANELTDFDNQRPALLVKLGNMGLTSAQAEKAADEKRALQVASNASVLAAMHAETDAMLQRQREALGNTADAQGFLNRNDPFGAQWSAINSKYDELRKDTRKANFGVLSAEDDAAISRAQASEIAGVDKNRSDTIRGLNIGYDTEANALRAGTDAASGRRSAYAPRIEAVIGGLRSEAFRLRLSGMSSQIPRATEVAQLHVDNDRANFFAAFEPRQHASLDEVDASGRDVSRVTQDFADGRRRLSGSALGSGLSQVFGAADAPVAASATEKVLRLIDRIDGTVANRFYRLSVDAMEGP